MATTAPLDTMLECLVAVARHHGVDLSADRLRHDYALDADDDVLTVALSIARRSGFRARVVTLRWADLAQLGQALPVIAQLDDGNSVIIAACRAGEPDATVTVLDPLVRGGPQSLDEASFCRRWSGRVVLLKRAHAVTDEAQPFGLGWFVPEILRQRSVFRDVIIAALSVQLLALALPIFIQIVLDKVLVHKAYTTLYVLLAGVGLALVFEAVFNFLRRYLSLYASTKIDIRVATRTFERLLSLPIDFFERSSAGVVVKHMQQAEKIREFFTGRLFMTALDTVTLVAVLPLLLTYSVTLTLVVLAISGLIAAIIAVLTGPFRRRLRALYEAEGERQAYLVETVTGMETVKALAIEPQRRKSWDARCAQAVRSHFRLGHISAAAQSLSGLLEKLMTVLIIAIGAERVFDGDMTVGALIAFQMLAGRVAGPLGQIVALTHEFQETGLSVRMLGEIMNRRPERPADARGLHTPIAGRIEFDAVTFRYGEAAPPALDHVSFALPAGSVLGIVGRSGSGKTTLTRLVRGIYPAQSGAVRIDGHDVREYDLPHLRRHIGIVLQQSFLFRGSVRENIAVSRPDASLEEVVAAANLAGADEFIQFLPQGYDTLIEEGGANLSGGQRQRIAIARALLRQPAILILDEATSSLDPESEAIVQANLGRIAEGRTTIIVSHRLSTLVAADAIIVLDKGRIIDAGRHAELLARCALYRQLWNQQHRHLRQA